ncbi:hypothetical protein B0H17DRAFT_1091564 [Mycena rosella]|uniref:F-box domain-containing protein n=1 Tax=Mycena rosella TaxID=1033263 RepID=A0AAD7CUM5_MYCRO|nr:hypothetical protein B0H17DRAFT_1091564 [Mycena rosella]
MSVSRLALPSELWDDIIDHLHDDPEALLACALVCRTWVPASRFHAFGSLALSQKSPYRAACLDILLASLHGTISPAVRTLDFPDALAPIQLQHVRTLTLSDLPWALLDALRGVENLTLTRLCVGACLLDVADMLPCLTHLTLEGVAAVPYRGPPHADAPFAHLHTLTIRASPLALLGWLAIGISTQILTADLLSAADVHSLAEYLTARGAALHVLDLAFIGSPLDESLLPLLLEPCTNLKTLRLQFTGAEAARAFFAFGGAFLPYRVEFRVEVVVPDLEALAADVLQIQNVDVSFMRC